MNCARNAPKLGKPRKPFWIPTETTIDAYLEEEDGLVLIDYKTDHVPEGSPEQGAKMLAERYRVQLDYYERALTQLTEKHVKERIIYSLALQMSINV